MKYRREIDGLRAIAVLPVILFHAGFSAFEGGYVGVDVFFVISGYLIGTIVLTELSEGRFSIRRFYERRARRILPALFVVILACLPFAWLWMFPSIFTEFFESVIATVLFVSNFHFWQQSGYFATAAEFKPLLHTWSLSVEEQFYILFPLLMIALWRFGMKAVIAAIVLVAIGSFALSEIMVRDGRLAAAFYLSPTRFWELAVGVLCAIILFKRAVKRSNLLSAAGLLAIMAAVVMFDKTTPFPGIFALVPVLGTAFVILFAHHDTGTARLLGHRAFVGIGLISYSAYLWHQPLFAFARIRSDLEPSTVLMLTLSVLSLGLAYLSYRFVEQPFRRAPMPVLPRQKQVFQASLAAMAALIVIGGAGVFGKGFAGRFDNIESPQRWAVMPCHGLDSVAQYADPLTACLGDRPNGNPGDIFLLGDSHAAQMTFPLRALAAQRGVGFAHMSNMRGQLPRRSYFEQVPPVRDIALEHMLRIADPGDYLVLIFHRGHLNASRDMHQDMETPVAENSKEVLFHRNFIHNITPFLDRGVNVVLVLDTPLLPERSWLERCAFTLLRFGSHGCRIARDQDEHTRTRQQRVFERIHRETRIPVLDPLPYLYSENGYFDPILPDGRYLMFDSNHLTELGVRPLLPLFATELIVELGG